MLSQGPSLSPGEVLCTEVRGTSLLLIPLTARCPTLTTGPCQLQFADASGILQFNGVLTGEEPARLKGVAHRALRFEVDLASATHSNRRASYRVGVTLKGELALFERDELGPPRPSEPGGRRNLPDGAQGGLANSAHLIRARKRPCIIQDLSLGGARVRMAEPPPRVGQTAVLDIALAPGDVLRNVEATVVQGGSGGGLPEFGAYARLRFHPMPRTAEARLARLISQVQLQTLRRGVRDRR
ncbi:MAG TPA: PilZ domain-containing protein [Deferrisomatales bacterium]|nr:PilZ domain-containing protein [Deferrisomatales bacterium]